MCTSFSQFYPVLSANEGGYQADPDDKGNFGSQPHTYAGIAGGYHPTWAGWKLVNAHRLAWLRAKRNLSNSTERRSFSVVLKADKVLQKLVRDFYESLYWDSLHLDLVASQSVAEQLADHGVNAGTSRIGWMVQWVLRTSFSKVDIVLDGKIGVKTLKAINSVSSALFHARFADLRRDFYRYRTGEYVAAPRHLALHQFFRTKLNLRTDTSQKKYLKTWLRRVDEMRFIA